MQGAAQQASRTHGRRPTSQHRAAFAKGVGSIHAGSECAASSSPASAGDRSSRADSAARDLHQRRPRHLHLFKELALVRLLRREVQPGSELLHRRALGVGPLNSHERRPTRWVLQMFLSGEPSPIPPYPRARATVHRAAPRRDRPSSVEPAANPVGGPRARTSPEHPQPCDRDQGVIARPSAGPRRAKHSRIASYCRGTVQDELPVDVGQRCRRSFCELVGFLRQALRDVAVTGWSQSTARVPVSAPSMELAAVAWRGAALDTSVRRRQTCDQPRHCQALPAHPEEHPRA